MKDHDNFSIHINPKAGLVKTTHIKMSRAQRMYERWRMHNRTNKQTSEQANEKPSPNAN